MRRYDTTLAANAHTTGNLSPYGAPPPDKILAHTNLYWEYQTAPGRTAGTVTGCVTTATSTSPPPPT